MRITAVTCVKNEGPFLLEWIAFHRVLGVTDFLFYYTLKLLQGTYSFIYAYRVSNLYRVREGFLCLNGMELFKTFFITQV